MEAILKDLEKLESKSVATTTALDEVQASIDALERWRDALADEATADMADDSDDAKAALGEAALQQLQLSSSRITDYNKEWFSAVTKYSKAVDKKFSQDLSPLIPVAANPTLSTSADDDSHMFFASEESKATLDNVLAMHFVRSGREDIARTFLQESGVQIPREKLMQFTTLHRVSDAIRKGDLTLAMRWADEHSLFLQKHQSPLRFHLHRSQYVRLLLSDTYPLPPSLATTSYIGVSERQPSAGHSASPRKLCQGASRALKYARAHFGQFHDSHAQEIRALSAAALYLPIDRLLASPYAFLFTTPGVATSDPSLEATPTIDPADPIYHAPHLVPLFASEFCSSINMSRELPLKVVTDIGGAGALAKIAKVKGVMKEKRTEWTTVQELPVEIPLPPKYRYHSVFACPVSKEQATEANPPMMMPCGHVVANQTLMHLCKGGQNVRCPYCPLSSAVSQAIRVYF